MRYFSNEIREEEARLQEKEDFAENKSTIHHSSNKVFQRHQRKKQKKLGSLITNKRKPKSAQRKLINNKTNKQGCQTTPSSINEADNTVVNFSTVQLSADEISLLSKGLGFCPTPIRLDTLEVK